MSELEPAANARLKLVGACWKLHDTLVCGLEKGYVCYVCRAYEEVDEAEKMEHKEHCPVLRMRRALTEESV